MQYNLLLQPKGGIQENYYDQSIKEIAEILKGKFNQPFYIYNDKITLQSNPQQDEVTFLTQDKIIERWVIVGTLRRDGAVTIMTNNPQIALILGYILGE